MTPFFRHYKGRYYQIIDEGLDTRDDSLVIVYRTLYSSAYPLFTRPKTVFFETVRLPDGAECPRFTPVDYADLPEDARAFVVESLSLFTDGKQA